MVCVLHDHVNQLLLRKTDLNDHRLELLQLYYHHSHYNTQYQLHSLIQLYINAHAHSQMAVIPRLVVRDGSSSTTTMTPTMMKLLIVLIVLVFFGICLAGGLLILRARRKAKQIEQLTDLPLHASRPSSNSSNQHRLTITTTPYGRHSKPITIYNEKEILVEESSQPSTPSSPVPEIRITFPEEEDEAGKSKSGRVVVVRISETGGLGLEPCNDEHLPAYQQSNAERFQSLDLDRMGGLKELERGEKI